MRAFWVRLFACALILVGPHISAAASKEVNVQGYERLLGIQLIKSKIEDAQRILGSAKPLPRREHQADRYCYRSITADDSTILVLEAGPAGGWKRVTGFWLYERPDRSIASKRCTASENVSRELAFGNGIKLGISRDEVKGSLGSPQKPKKNSWIYVKERRIGKGDATVDVMNWLEFRFEEDRVVTIGSVKTETN